MDSINCGKLYPDQPGSGSLGKHQLALVYGFCGRQSFSIITHSMVPDGGYPRKNGFWEEITPLSKIGML
jgi:hypothetical protein